MATVTSPKVLQHPNETLHDGMLIELDPATLTINDHNIRMIGSQSIRDLTNLDSIATHGVIEPLVITPARAIVCGHRRQAKAIEAKLPTVPCIVRDLTEEEQIQVALIENLGRTGITPNEEAVAYQMLIDMGLDVATVAAKVNVSAAVVGERVELLFLPPVARKALDDGVITYSTAKRLLALKDYPEEIEKFAKKWARFGAEHPYSDTWEIENVANSIQTKETKKRLKVEATAAGVKVVAMPPAWGRKPGEPIRLGKGHDEIDIAPAKHKKRKCHAVAIEANGDKGRLVPICTDPASHDDIIDPAVRQYPTGGDGTNWQAERERRERVNTGLKEAHDARLAVWRTLVEDEDVLMDLFRLSQVSNAVTNWGAEALCAILGTEVGENEDPRDLLLAWLVEDPTQREERERQLFNAVLVEAIERRLSDTFKGWNHPFVVRSVTALTAHGYELTEIERELWEGTAEVRTAMEVDPRARYIVAEDEDDVDGSSLDDLDEGDGIASAVGLGETDEGDIEAEGEDAPGDD